MLLWLFSLLIPSAFSNVIDSHNTYINYNLVYQGNLDVFQNNSLRFSTALQEEYYLFNIDYDYSMYPCFEMCSDISGCQGIFNLPGRCVGLSYLGERPHTTILVSESYQKVINTSIAGNLSCYDRCGIGQHFFIESNNKCWCDRLCPYFNDCCSDYDYYCIDHCLENNGGCSQSCETIDFGAVNCSCDEGYFLGDDLKTCHPENSVVGKIFDNIHEMHTRNISLLLIGEDENYTLYPNFSGEFMLHNLTDGNYTLQQKINMNCTQKLPTLQNYTLTLPTDREYDFYNFCGLNCKCQESQYLSYCNYVTGFGQCNQCEVCQDTHHTIQECTNITNTICELITSTPTTTDTTTQSTTLTTSQTLTDTTTQTLTDTTTQTLTDTTSQTLTDTTSQTTTPTTTESTTPTVTFKISKNQESNSASSINYQTITIVLGVLLLLLILMISVFFIKYNNVERSSSISDENQEPPSTIAFSNTTDTFSNPVFHPEDSNGTYYQDVDFEETNQDNHGYMDVMPEETLETSNL